MSHLGARPRFGAFPCLNVELPTYVTLKLAGRLTHEQVKNLAKSKRFNSSDPTINSNPIHRTELDDGVTGANNMGVWGQCQTHN